MKKTNIISKIEHNSKALCTIGLAAIGIGTYCLVKLGQVSVGIK